MYWATHKQPVPLSEIGWINTTYLGSASPRCDPMMVWGTTVDMEELETFLKKHRKQHSSFLTPAHILVRAVAESLHQHPEVNRRVIGRKVYQYDGVNIVMPMLQANAGEVDCVFMRNAEDYSLDEVSNFFWAAVREKALKAAEEKKREKQGSILNNFFVRLGKQIRIAWILHTCRLGFAAGNRLRCPTIWPWQRGLNHAGAFVNYLGFPGAPPLTAYKPSALPMNSYSVSVTMGPTEPQPVVIDNEVIIRKQASLFVRLDHRMVNGNQSAAFINTLRSYLANPQTLIPSDEICEFKSVA